jgi:hypothetical protein
MLWTRERQEASFQGGEEEEAGKAPTTQRLGDEPTMPEPVKTIAAATTASPFAEFEGKYKTAYGAAESLKNAGAAFKFFAALAFFFGVATAFAFGSLGLLGLGAGVIFGLVIYGMGILIQAIAEILSAILDTAVSARASAEKAWEEDEEGE